MSDVSKKKSQQDQAIHDYLKSLLLEVPDEPENKSPIKKVDPSVKPVVSVARVTPSENEKPVIELDVKPVNLGLDQLVAEIPDVIAPPIIQEVIETQVEVVTQTQVNVETQVASDTIEPTQTAVPDWAENRFQCLLFKVPGLSLAVPLIKLNSVIPWDENITTTPNQTDWYLGLVQHLQNQIKVIDTALLVMPENRRDNLESDTENRLSHILLVDDYQWGLACSSIGDVIWLNQDEVKWRKNKNSRAWLSGTSLEHLCAIIDTEVFAKMLTKSS